MMMDSRESNDNPDLGVDIERLAAQVPQFASRERLTVVPVTPVSQKGWGYLVLLDHSHLNAAEFCALAASAGAKLLYFQTEDFNVRTDPSVMVGGSGLGRRVASVSDELTEFRRYVESFDGRIRQLELAFVVGGVLHCWAVAADWYLDLVDRAAQLIFQQEST
jgi:hypothetical protein